jgi:DNA uptake protein ComE-like DNA-binding protein
VLDANTATAEEMAVLPHMDEAMAGAIISNRPYAHDRCAARTSRC